MNIKDITGLGEFAPIFTELYKDMAQPAARNVGLALGAITSIGLFLHLLTSWGTDRLNLCLKNNLELYGERIKEIAPEELTEAVPEVVIPIVEKLSYVTNEELRKLYIELLAKASIRSENNKAHPNFTNIINALSPDEALLTNHINKVKWLPIADISLKSTHNKEYVLEDLLCIIPDLDLAFSNNLKAYLNNLNSLGLIVIKHGYSAGDQNSYTQYEQYLADNKSYYEVEYSKIEKNTAYDNPYAVNKGIISITKFGQLFFDAVH